MDFQLTPLITLSGQVLINLRDGSLFAAPQLEYNLSENIYLSAGLFWSFGREPGFRTDQGMPPATAMESEFGAYPDMAYTSFRVYF